MGFIGIFQDLTSYLSDSDTVALSGLQKVSETDESFAGVYHDVRTFAWSLQNFYGDLNQNMPLLGLRPGKRLKKKGKSK